MNFSDVLSKLLNLDAVSPNQVKELIADKRATIIDVNSLQSWRRAHVPTATHLDPESFSDSDLPTEKASDVIFYCSNPMCRKAPKAARRAEKMGYSNVKVMSAGISGWISSGLPVEQGT